MGFTLLEILIVVTILALLIALILPAVQASREAARKTDCANNLRQMGIAINTYENDYGCFPLGNAGRGLSMHVSILPYMEDAPLFNSINFKTQDIVYISSCNDTSLNTTKSDFLCPSDTYVNYSNDRHNNCYVGNNGTKINKYGHIDDGIFLGGRKTINPASILDGLSHTAGLTEWSRASSLYNTSSFISDEDSLSSTCKNIDRNNIVGIKTSTWSIGSLGNTLYDHIMNIGENSCLNSNDISGGAWTAGGNHPDGANVLFMDSHVIFIKKTIDISIWRSIGTRSGGETFSSEY